MILTTKTPRTRSDAVESSIMPTNSQDSQSIGSNKSTISKEKTKGTTVFGNNKNNTSRSAPCTPTGLRPSVDAYNRGVPLPNHRLSAFGSDVLSCCTPDYQKNGVVHTILSPSSSSVTNDVFRSVNLYDLIDEEFVVNSGVNKKNNSSSTRPTHRRKKSILDMIDRIDTMPEADDDDNRSGRTEDHSSSAMTTRSYPRGVYVVPPEERRETAAIVGNTVAFVSAEAYNQW
mmetsp:Transcript_26251/g.56295  ORF Transcript_26251/g.56295 Transcript_26251/m.56295 type:complete len:230 (+) Transcript_26251:320-1009(+)|eukprot:CAMPEP_0201124144 /NCGR_PEP_ID=MMETSP0850-20130426/10583_1 /ASSEMBLY_ACC=CAM_ASM_000622 /TAXON_ID=183588 /ORGANISM="Pseudo-nitzschia fraudulenta, Strain WWA7" /LENGTH=229 /DNA_ID=CAMNT_0047391337 /DNA_START=229 /DNA_END=915 /DNA_ORIENTATION=+